MKLMDRAFCVVGPPGCGKTYSISKSVKRNIEQHGPGRVIVCSLTRTAAAEAAGRVGLPRKQVGTLHSFAYRALDRPELAEPRISEWNKEHPNLAISNSTSDVNAQASFDTRVAGGAGDERYAEYNLLRAKMKPRELWPSSVQSFARKWEEWKEANFLLDFTDLIEFAARDTTHAPGAPAVIYMDEAQDSSTLEAELLKNWSLGIDKTVIVGDPNQSLYAWRGADPEEFFPADLPSERKWVLGQSYRVPRAVLDTSLRWIKSMPGYKNEPYLPRKDDSGVEVKGRSEFLPQADLKRPGPLLDHAQRKMAQGKSVMVLASCGYMLNSLVYTLREQGIPFHNPYRRKAGNWNPLHGSGVTGRKRLLSWLAPRQDLWGEDAKIWTIKDVQRWGGILEAKGVFRRGMKKQIEGAGEDMRPEDLAESLAEWFEPDALDRVVNQDLDWWKSRIMKTRRKGLEFPLLVLRKRGPQALMDEPKLVVGTIHSVKGGQADVVYVSPEMSMAGLMEWRQRSPSVYRLFYVAMTRAREELYLLSSGGPGMAVEWG